MTSPPDATRVIGAVRATWGPARLDPVGPFDVPDDTTGGRRNCAARLRQIGGQATAADLSAVERHKPRPVFATLDGAEEALAELLATAGYADEGRSTLMAGPVAPLLAEPVPPVSGFRHWPPLAVTRELWAEQGAGPDRLAVAARAPDPKAAILLRAFDSPVGALFVARHEDMVCLHMVYTRPEVRRRGVAMTGLRHAALFARDHGARWLVLPVETSNTGARALYARAGFAEVGGYRYWRKPAA